jgi:hypothetical protein
MVGIGGLRSHVSRPARPLFKARKGFLFPKGSMKKVTAEQYYNLQSQFERTPAPDDSMGASGEHYVLVAMLRSLGYNEPDKWKALRLAERILTNGFSS